MNDLTTEPETAAEPTRADVLAAAEVLAHLNAQHGYPDTNWWSPFHLHEIAGRIPDWKGRKRIGRTIRVIQAMNADRGYPDVVGYAPIAVRRWADQMPATQPSLRPVSAASVPTGRSESTTTAPEVNDHA